MFTFSRKGPIGGFGVLACMLLTLLLIACGNSTSMTAYDPAPQGDPPVPLYPSQILLTTNSGKTWQAVYTQPNTSIVLANVYCATSTDCFVAERDGKILSSVDGGKTWKEFGKVPAAIDDDNRLSCLDTSTCLFKSTNDLFSTLDSGKTWEFIGPARAAIIGYTDIGCPAKNTCFVVENNSRILATTDSGKTWAESQPQPGKLYALSCLDVVNCMVVGSSFDDKGMVIKTTDGGKNWQTVYQDIIGVASEINCPSVKVCYVLASSERHDVLGGRSVFVTTDGGNFWTEQNPPGVVWNSLSCPTELVCYVTSYDKTVFITTDGGIKWTTLPTGATGRLNKLTCPSPTSCLLLTDNH